jgi:hypothetical protein
MLKGSERSIESQHGGVLLVLGKTKSVETGCIKKVNGCSVHDS